MGVDPSSYRFDEMEAEWKHNKSEDVSCVCVSMRVARKSTPSTFEFFTVRFFLLCTQAVWPKCAKLRKRFATLM